MKPRRLGRGLDFLLQGAAETAPEPMAITPAASVAGTAEVNLTEISPNPWQPRTQFEEAGLAELTESIRTHGVLQPLVVRAKAAGGFELVAGERRLLAAKRAGLSKVPVTVRAIGDQEMLIVALIENVQRRDLNPLERARAFRRLADEQKLSHERIAELAGMGRSTVSNSLRLLELAPEHADALASGVITEGHARALLAEADVERRAALFSAIRDQHWNVRVAESATAPKSAARKPTSPDAIKLAARLREALGTKVTIVERGKSGRIVIAYSSLKEFDRLFERLSGAPTETD
ncbi:MAG: ParB/RepB/Spo0J family partition protein [Planctomycetes bacterium]|nr:ParB/RepB/Spo0J family partition protein [Planctomycetota bacterium]